MSFIYTSNSPEFLNYVASVKTRNDVLSDPSLCVLFEDPHIKDNMELAFLYREAEYGDYEAKKTFVGFFLANGPELDNDTLMYFRDKIMSSTEYMDIYKENFSDISSVDQLRINQYNKRTTESDDSANCLENPCEYLGPFSSSIGLIGDDRNFNTLSNVFSRITSSENEIGKGKEGSLDGDDKKSSLTWGNIRQHVISKLIPDVEKAYRAVMGNMSSSFEDFAKKLIKLGLEKETKTIGDKHAEQMAKDIAPSVKVNVVSNLGDCARIWEQMRRLRVYDPSKNAKGPIATTLGNKNVDGTPKRFYSPLDDSTLKPKPIATSTVGGPGTTLIKESSQA